MPATLSIITNVFPREERGKAIGIWAGMAAIGIGLGPLFGGLLLEWFSLDVGLPGQRAGRGRRPRSRASRSSPRAAIRGPAASTSSAPDSRSRALVALVYGVIEAPERGWTSPLILGCFGASAVLIAAFVALGAAHARSDAQPLVLPQPALQRRARRRSASRSSRSSARSSRSRSTCSTRTATARSRPAPRWCRSRSAW